MFFVFVAALGGGGGGGAKKPDSASIVSNTLRASTSRGTTLGCTLQHESSRCWCCGRIVCTCECAAGYKAVPCAQPPLGRVLSTKEDHVTFFYRFTLGSLSILIKYYSRSSKYYYNHIGGARGSGAPGIGGTAEKLTCGGEHDGARVAGAAHAARGYALPLAAISSCCVKSEAVKYSKSVAIGRAKRITTTLKQIIHH